MKKTKIEQRIKNAANAFFENEPEHFGERSLVLTPDSALLKQETATLFDEKGEHLIKILKRVLLFFPGALYLFFGTFTILEFEFLQNPLTILAIFLIGSFMTIFGLGSLKKPKHLAIPLSISAVGTAAFGIFSTFGNSRYIFDYGIYFFPIALIAAILAKNLTDEQNSADRS